MEEAKDYSRRKFLISTLLVGAGALTGCGVIKTSEMATSTPAPATNPVPAATPAVAASSNTLPWPYKTLDLAVVRKRSYENYFKNGCCYGAASGLIDTLKETVGAPWDVLPTDMFTWGGGGGLGWGTLCGALNGSLYVMKLATGKDMNPLGNELIGWYTEFPFPSKENDAFAKFPNQITDVSKSPLCHISLSSWCAKANVKFTSDEAKYRCAKLAADTAAKAAELLNQWKEGKFLAAYKASPENSNCMSCHNGKTSTLNNDYAFGHP